MIGAGGEGRGRSTRRHRLNRGGDRQANAALHRIVVARLGHDRRTQDYVARRLSQGKSRKEPSAVSLDEYWCCDPEPWVMAPR
jgi:hypothetical protein